jgi:hypothetical protein
MSSSSPSATSSSEAVVVVKLKMGSDCRRRTIHENISFQKFCAMIEETFAGEVEYPFHVKYRDEDGDWISVFSDEEMREAFAQARATHKRRIPPLPRCLANFLIEKENFLPPSSAASPSSTATLTTSPSVQEVTLFLFSLFTFFHFSLCKC